jgi:hypothetical protein
MRQSQQSFSLRCHALEPAQPDTRRAILQSLLWAAFTIQEYNNGKLVGTAMAHTAERAELLSCVRDHLLREIVQQALQATHATGAAIALEQQGKLICRAAAGDFASEIGKMIDTGSGFTGECVRAGDRGSHFRRLVPEPMIHQREPRLAGTR